MNRETARLVLIFPLIAAISGYSFSAEKFISESFSVLDDVKFVIDSHYRGNIEIRIADIETIEFRATAIHENQEFLDILDVEFVSAPERVSAKVIFDRDINFSSARSLIAQISSRDPFIEISVTLPRNAFLNVDSHESSLDIEAPNGGVEIRTHKGGGIITDIRSDFNIATHAGQFDIEIEELGNTLLKTHQGRISTTIIGANNFDVDGSTRSGDFSFTGEHEITFHKSFRDTNVFQRIGTGEHRIVLDSHKGKIAINFLESHEDQ